MLTILRSKLRTLKNHRGFRLYAANTSWMMAEQMLRIISGLLVGIWVARYLGPEQFGLFSYVLAFTAIFGGIAKLGLDGILVRNLITQPELKDTWLGTAFWLKVVGAFLVISMIALIVPFTSNDATTNFYIFIISTGLLFQSFEVVEFYFQSQVLAKIVSICKMSQLALSSAIKVYLVLRQAELVWFVLITAFDSLSLAVSYSIAYRNRKNQNFYKYFDLNIAKKLLTDSWPLIFSGIALMVQARIDQVMIKEFRGAVEVGYYSVAMRLIEAIAFVPMLLKNSLFPAIQNSKIYSEISYRKRLLDFYRLNFLMFLIFGLPIFVFSETIVVSLFGKEYQPAGALLALLSVRLFFANMGVARSAFLICENLMKFSLVTMALGTLVNIVLNFLWIPLYGAKGAILATIVSFSVTIYFVDIFYSKTRWNVILQLKSILTFYKLGLRG
jgi:O-antigen/teichoic acid export membrane protein